MRVIPIIVLLMMAIVAVVGVAPAVLADANAPCLECHAAGNEAIDHRMDPEVFVRSVHGDTVACLDCHPAAGDDSHQEHTGVTPVDCRQCHEDQGRHGSGVLEAPCRDCHGAHDIFTPDMPESRLHPERLVETCGGCHPEQATPGVGSALLSFRVKGHGKADAIRAYTPHQCLDCHQGGGAHGESSPLTPATCHCCHDPAAGDDLFFGSIHAGFKDAGPQSWAGLGDRLYWVCLGLAGLIFILGWGKRIHTWFGGGKSNRFDHPWRRFTGMLRWVASHRRFERRPKSGRWHRLILWGWLLPFGVILLIQPGHSFLGFLSGLLSLTLDVAGLALVAGVVLGLADRLGKTETDPSSPVKVLPLWFLALLGLIGLTGFGVEALRLAVTHTPWQWQHPVGGLLSTLMPDSPLGVKVLWRFHFLLVLAFLALTPFTSLRHVVTAPLNIYFRKLEASLLLDAIPVDAGTHFGVASARDLTWKGLLDADTCLGCGRCQSACPAFQTRKPLSPMAVMGTLGDQADSPAISMPSPVMTADEMWACTTCGACQNACPVAIEPMTYIVGARRAAVLNQGDVPVEAADMLRKLEVFGAPGGEGPAQRRDWLVGMETGGLVAPGRDHTLLWVGCQGAFHPRARETARALVRLAERAGTPLSILGHDESCCGDPARRLGQEALFQELAKRNIEKMRGQKITDIVTLCPHCRNVLANEYPGWDGHFIVRTGLEWAIGLMTAGKLEIRRQLDGRGVYHDPCYMARGAGLVELPHRIGRRLWVDGMAVPSANGADTFCCGAGGGAMWVHEAGDRINHRRAAQLEACGAQTAATACPFCLSMLEDGLGQSEEAPLPVMDLVEALEWATR